VKIDAFNPLSALRPLAIAKTASGIGKQASTATIFVAIGES